MRTVWLVFGLLCIGIGLIGVAVPLLPTVPFMLLAAFCFARSSERLHHWLLSHRYFGPAIIDWRERGAVNRRAKWLATFSVLALLAISYMLGLRPLILVIQSVTLACVLLFLWTRPSY